MICVMMWSTSYEDSRSCSHIGVLVDDESSGVMISHLFCDDESSDMMISHLSHVNS